MSIPYCTHKKTHRSERLSHRTFSQRELRRHPHIDFIMAMSRSSTPASHPSIQSASIDRYQNSFPINHRQLRAVAFCPLSALTLLGFSVQVFYYLHWPRWVDIGRIHCRSWTRREFVWLSHRKHCPCKGTEFVIHFLFTLVHYQIDPIHKGCFNPPAPTHLFQALFTSWRAQWNIL